MKNLDQVIQERVEEAKKNSLPFKYKMTRVHKKEIAGEGKIYLVVETKGGDAKNGWFTYSSYIKVPVNLSDEHFLEAATEMYKGLVKKYNLTKV